ncbi:MFS transporter [Vagococcus penaei]|uniref:Uncharacterized protein n=1 Tax=Vagococcus penaei TaxID=633807 RepID=A0A1Q2D5I3_9ENTE|nr:MFS transporter [Vagococcus penaei]AQP53613.1 hypothetical protein BW732_04775 [Vagococcus penaei]RSU07558.1 MFS transporter [Vagococcus penaei]
MKQTHRTMEIIAILSLSLMLTSTLSVSGVIPELLLYFNDYSRSSVEWLISVTSIATTIMVGLNPLVSKVISERKSVILGLLLTGIAGVIPFFIVSYPVILVSRIFIGVGIGFLNTRAISLIGERFSGNMRSKLLGFRVSAETIGQTVLTLAAGQLLLVSWQAPFLIYLTAFLILGLYLVYGPKDTLPASDDLPVTEVQSAAKLTRKQVNYVLVNTLFLGILISISVSTILRIPSLLVEQDIGTVLVANRTLSLFMFAGFLAGLCFGSFVVKFGRYILPVFLVISSLGLGLLVLSQTIIFSLLGAFLAGFALTICVSCVFNNLSENITKEALNTANSIVLVGSNLGAATAPLLLGIIAIVNPDLRVPFGLHALILLVIAALLLAKIPRTDKI